MTSEDIEWRRMNKYGAVITNAVPMKKMGQADMIGESMMNGQRDSRVLLGF